MKTQYLFTDAQAACLRQWIEDTLKNNPDLELAAFAIALGMLCQSLDVIVMEDFNCSMRDNLCILLRIFGYTIVRGKIVKIEQ